MIRQDEDAPSYFLFYLSFSLGCYLWALFSEGERERLCRVWLGNVKQARGPSAVARQNIFLPLKTMPTANSPLSYYLCLINESDATQLIDVKLLGQRI